MNKKGWAFVTAIAMMFSLCGCDLIPGTQPNPADSLVISDIVIEDNNDDINSYVLNHGNTGEDGKDDDTESETSDVKLYYYPEEAEVSIEIQTHQYEVYELMEASEAYFDFLEEEAEQYNQDTGFDDGLQRMTFNFVDIDGDNLSELAYSFNGSHAYGVSLATYDMEKGEVVPLGEIGSYGDAIVYASRNMAISGYSGMGYTYVAFITFDDDHTMRNLVEFENDEWAVENPEDAVFTINGEEVSKDEYERVYETWRTYYSANYQMLDYSYMIPYYDGEVKFDNYSYPLEREPEDCQLVFDNYEMILEQMGCPAFTLAYMDGDNVPELAIAYGDNEDDGVYVFKYNFAEGMSIRFGQYGIFGKLDYVDGTGILVHKSPNYGGREFFYMSDIAVVPLNSFVDTETVLGEYGDNNYKMNGMFVEKEVYLKYRKSWDEIDYSEISYTSMEKDYSSEEIQDLFQKLKS